VLAVDGGHLVSSLQDAGILSHHVPSSAVAIPRLPPAAGVACLAFLLGAVFFLSLPGNTLWQRVLSDAGHGPVFAGIAIALLLMVPSPSGAVVRPASAYWRAFVLATSIGVVTELIQFSMSDRSVSFMDALHDAAGAALGLALVWFVERGLARGQGDASDKSYTGTVVAIALLTFTILAWLPLQCARACAARNAAFPLLVPTHPLADTRFALPHQAEVSHAPLPEAYRVKGDKDSVRLEFTPGTAPGLQLVETYPDWRSYDILAIDVTNPGPEPVLFVVSVLDAQHDWSSEDRFNQPVEIPAATRTTIRIALEAVATAPASRRMDLSAVRDLMLYAPQPLPVGEFYITRIWLE
jgi:hypothetical protein